MADEADIQEGQKAGKLVARVGEEPRVGNRGSWDPIIIPHLFPSLSTLEA